MQQTQSIAQVAKQCWTLAWPVSLQSVVVAVLGMIDVMMVGHLGNSAVAAVGLASRAQFVLITIFAAFGVGASVFAAQYLGAKRQHQLSGMAAQVLGLGLALALPLIVIALYLVPTLMMMGSQDADVVALGTQYLYITLPSLLVVLVIQITEGMLRGVGQVKLPLYFGVLAMGLNVLLNHLFINGVGGFPEMGVAGAAWATNVARVFQLALLLAFLLGTRHYLVPRMDDWQVLRQFEPLWKTIKVIMPMALNFGVWAAGTFAYQLIFGSLGTEALATVSMLAPVEGTVISLFIGFGTACAILVGQKLGANQFELAFKYARDFSGLITILAFVIGGAVILASDWVLMPYQQANPTTLQMASSILLVMALGMGIKTLNLMLSLGVLRAGGDNRFCLQADLICMWLIGIPLTLFVASTGAPLIWVYIATFSEEIGKNLMMGWRMASKRWMRNLVDAQCSA